VFRLQASASGRWPFSLQVVQPAFVLKLPAALAALITFCARKGN
jgi:hypothetical protein